MRLPLTTGTSHFPPNNSILDHYVAQLESSVNIHCIKMSLLTYHITACAIFDILPFASPAEEEEEEKEGFGND